MSDSMRQQILQELPTTARVNSAGYSNAAWAVNQNSSSISWKSDTMSADPNANALRWGTMYNFRFDSTQPPQSTYAVVGFFKSGAPIQVQIQGPTATACQPGSRR